MAGCGAIARAHVAAMGARPILALCDQNRVAAARLRDELGGSAPVFSSLENALEHKPDVVVVCTPPSSHFDLVRLALQSGASVLCEKPLATNAFDARSLVELAQAQGKTLRTSAKYRFCEGVVKAKAWLDSGEAGELQSAHIAFGAPFDFAKSWHANTSLSGGGVWMDNGPHALDLARYFAGELRFDSVEEWNCEGTIETQVRARLRSTQGVDVGIALSWKHWLSDDFALLRCERGTLHIGWQQTKWCEHAKDARVLAGAYDKTACFASQWNGFASGDARLGEEDGARVVELLETVGRAARS